MSEGDSHIMIARSAMLLAVVAMQLRGVAKSEITLVDIGVINEWIPRLLT